MLHYLKKMDSKNLSKKFGPPDEKDDLTINPFTNLANIHFIPTILNTD